MTLAVTFDPELCRVRLNTAGLSGATSAVVERSTTGVRWTTVRGGADKAVTSGALRLDDYEFAAGVPNFYRVRTEDVVTAGADTFGRTVASGWGTPDTGPAYTVTGTASEYSVSSGAGRMSLATVSTPRAVTLPVEAADVDVTFTVTASALPVSGNAEAHCRIRLVDSSNFIDVRLFLLADDSATISVRQRIAGVDTDGAFPAVPGVDATDAIKVRVQAIGGMLKAHAWLASDPDPAPGTWTVTLAVTWLTAGAVQLRGMLDGTVANAPISLAFDNLAVTNLAPVLTGQITPEMESIWLKSIGKPFLNREVMVIGRPEETRPARGGAFEVKGRADVVAVTDVRGSKAFTLTVRARTQAEADTLELLLSPGDVLFIHRPPDCRIPGGYVVVGETAKRATSQYGSAYMFELPCRVTAAPGPDVVGATATCEAILNHFETCADVLIEFATCADLLDFIADPEDVVVE